MTNRADAAANFVVAAGLPLERLYARFDAIARRRIPGDSSAVHQPMIERLAFNQRRAAALGWTDFVLEQRAAGCGRLELRGVRATGGDHELVPDALPSPDREPTGESKRQVRLPPDVDAVVGNRLAKISWRSRMRWLDDGGR